MKANYKTKVFIITTVSILLLTACGGEGKKSDSIIQGQVPIVTKIVKCSTNTYSSLKKGDKIIALENDTEMNIRHSEDGKKEACVIIGEAKIN